MLGVPASLQVLSGVCVMNPSNPNNKTRFTPASVEAKLADMKLLIAKYTDPDAEYPITGGRCDVRIIEWEHSLLVDGQVDEMAHDLYKGFLGEFVTLYPFQRVGSKMEFTHRVYFEEDYALLRCHVDMIMFLQTCAVFLGDVDA
jgi:hypothetical protein